MKTFLLFLLTLNAQDGTIVDSRPISEPMTWQECSVAQAGRLSVTKDGKVQMWECRNIRRNSSPYLGISDVQQPSTAPAATRVLGVIELRYCGELVGLQLQLLSSEGPSILTMLAEQMEPAELAARYAALEDLRKRGGPVYVVELRPDCVSV